MATAGDMDLSQDLKERGDWDDLRRDSRVAVRKGTAWTKAGSLDPAGLFMGWGMWPAHVMGARLCVGTSGNEAG